MLYTLTVDAGLMRQHILPPALQTLKDWETQGKIEIFETDRAKDDGVTPGWPGGPKAVKVHPKYKASRKNESGGITFRQISAVLFPRKDPNRLNMSETNSVAHLVRHYNTGRSIFITNNLQDFIADGRREHLQVSFKIVVLTPEEAVTVLEKSERWGKTEVN